MFISMLNQVLSVFFIVQTDINNRQLDTGYAPAEKYINRSNGTNLLIELFKESFLFVRYVNRQKQL